MHVVFFLVSESLGSGRVLGHVHHFFCGTSTLGPPSQIKWSTPKDDFYVLDLRRFFLEVFNENFLTFSQRIVSSLFDLKQLLDEVFV